MADPQAGIRTDKSTKTSPRACAEGLGEQVVGEEHFDAGAGLWVGIIDRLKGSGDAALDRKSPLVPWRPHAAISAGSASAKPRR